MGKHTPGPWHWNSYSMIQAVVSSAHPLNAAEGDEPAYVDVACLPNAPNATHIGDARYCPEIQANARLIASAPDLLQIAKEMLEEIEQEEPFKLSECAPTSDPYRWLTVIARAEGKS